MTSLYHIESEQSVIGGLLIDPNAFDRIDWLEESDFYRKDHQIIFSHVVMLVSERKPVDVVTVAESLASSGVDDAYIGLAYLGELASNTPGASNIRRYAEVVKEKRLLRDLLAASQKIAEIANSAGSESVAQRIDDAEAIVFALAENSSKKDDEPKLIGTVLSSVVEDIQERFERGGAITGLSTGFSDLDQKTCGLGGGDLVIIAGRPSMGKTAIAMNIAEHVALNEGKPALVFSMEMGEKQLTERALSSIGGIDLDMIRSGRLDDDAFSRLGVAVGKLFHAQLLVDDRPALSVSQMRSRARRVIKKHGSLALIVVDYIQLARGDSVSRNSSREQEVSSVSRGLKAIAKEFNVPVVALAQLSRKVEERGDKRPMISDLRESGAIEQDADLILMMYRDDYYHSDSPYKGSAEVIIGKQRMGETGVVILSFQGMYSRFKNLTGDAMRDMNEARRELASTPKRRRGID